MKIYYDLNVSWLDCQRIQQAIRKLGYSEAILSSNTTGYRSCTITIDNLPMKCNIKRINRIVTKAEEIAKQEWARLF